MSPPPEPRSFVVSQDIDYPPGTGCLAVAHWQAVVLALSQPVAAGDVVFVGDEEEPPSPVPVPALGPVLPGTCARADSADRSADVTVADYVGIVTSCVAGSGGGVLLPGLHRPRVSNPAEDRTKLLIEWDTTPCDIRSGVWPGDEDLDFDYMVTVEQQAPPDDACTTTETERQAVILHFHTPIPADAFEVVVTGAEAPPAIVQTAAGRFTLRTSASRNEYVAGETIDVTATLTYEGLGEHVELSTDGPVTRFRYRQLDGELAMDSGRDLICRDFEMQADDARVDRARPVVRWSSDDPNVDWYRSWAESSELWLPPGTWLVRAWTTFFVGYGCPDEPVRLSGSVILRVTSSGSSGPSR